MTILRPVIPPGPRSRRPRCRTCTAMRLFDSTGGDACPDCGTICPHRPEWPDRRGFHDTRNELSLQELFQQAAEVERPARNDPRLMLDGLRDVLKRRPALDVGLVETGGIDTPQFRFSFNIATEEKPDER